MSMDNNVVIAAERHRNCHRRTVKLCCDVLSKALPSLAMVSISEGRRTSTATGFASAKERLGTGDSVKLGSRERYSLRRGRAVNQETHPFAYYPEDP
jgi:hypothetical protein